MLNVIYCASTVINVCNIIFFKYNWTKPYYISSIFHVFILHIFAFVVCSILENSMQIILLIFKISENEMKLKGSQPNFFILYKSTRLAKNYSFEISGRKVCWFQKYIFGATICNIIFLQQLGAEKSENRAGLGTLWFNFCYITSK